MTRPLGDLQEVVFENASTRPILVTSPSYSPLIIFVFKLRNLFQGILNRISNYVYALFVNGMQNERVEITDPC